MDLGRTGGYCSCMHMHIRVDHRGAPLESRLELRSAPMVKMVRRNGTIPPSSVVMHVLRRVVLLMCEALRVGKERTRNRGALGAVRVPGFPVS